MAGHTITDATIEAYERYAHVYDADVADFWRNFPPTTVTAFVKHLPGKRVLDLGSGSGRDALLLREAGCEVVCLDGSRAMVAMTKAMGFESHVVRFEQLSLERETYDGVWAYTSLLHLPTELASHTLVTVEESIQPRGLLMVGMIEGEFEGMIEQKSMPDTSRFFRYYNEEELGQMIGPLGFTKIYQERYMPRSKIYLHQLYQKV